MAADEEKRLQKKCNDQMAAGMKRLREKSGCMCMHGCNKYKIFRHGSSKWQKKKNGCGKKCRTEQCHKTKVRQNQMLPKRCREKRLRCKKKIAKGGYNRNTAAGKNLQDKQLQ